jgi:hypothetical protein
MIIEALVSWNRHIPKEDMKTVNPGDLVNIKDSIGRYMVKEGWGKLVR